MSQVTGPVLQEPDLPRADDEQARGMLAWQPRLVQILGKVHLLYLGLLPSLTTFAVLRTYGYALPFLLFVVGVAAVGIYLAVTYSYTVLPNSLFGSLWVLLDGPLFVLLGRRGKQAMPLGFAVEAFFVDGIAIWFAVLWLSLASWKPTRGQRVASVVILIAVLGVTGSLFWPYARDVLWGRWLLVGSLVAGFAEGAYVRIRLLDAEAVVRESGDKDTLYIAGLVMLWVGSMIAGMAMHEAG